MHNLKSGFQWVALSAMVVFFSACDSPFKPKSSSQPVTAASPQKPGQSQPAQPPVRDPAIADDEHDHAAVDLETCDAAVRNVSQVRDTELLADCMDFYWHNGGADLGFNKIIKIGYRLIDLDPQDTTTYTAVAWLLWSKWVTWNKNPEDMPDGETKADEAITLLLRGRAANPNDADYHQDCGDTIFPLARFHKPDLWKFVVESYELAEKSSEEAAQKLRVRLNIAHAYRYQEKWSEALASYLAVVKLDPSNRPAIMNTGLSLRKLAKYDEAIQYYDKVLANQATYTPAILGKAGALREAGRKEEAIKVYEAVLVVDPKNEEALHYIEELKKPDGGEIKEFIGPSNPDEEDDSAPDSNRPETFWVPNDNLPSFSTGDLLIQSRDERSRSWDPLKRRSPSEVKSSRRRVDEKPRADESSDPHPNPFLQG